MRIAAFKALRPGPDVVSRVACVPYDTVDTDEARDLVQDNPSSFLRVIRPEVNFESDTDPYGREVYEKAREMLQFFLEQGWLQREEQPSIYVYRLKMGTHEQSGVVTCCHIEDYERHLIKRHENTLADKEFDRMRILDALNAQTGPVFLMYRDVPDIDAAVATCRKQAPLFRFTAGDGVEHTVWRVGDTAALTGAFSSVPVCYVADGHHRAAAAARVGVECREGNAAHTGDEDYNWFLSVLFPSSQLQIFPYNRLVRDLNGLSRHAFLAAVGERCAIGENAPPDPPSPRCVSMYLAGKWYGLSWEADEVTARQPSLMASGGGTADPVSALDVTFLHEQILGPVLGVWDSRSEPRISFVGGIRGTEALVRRVDSGSAAVAFSMHPVTVDQVMDVADAGRNMPPKSTWFEPKLSSGLFIHTF